jgi:hypothetical protein
MFSFLFFHFFKRSLVVNAYYSTRKSPLAGLSEAISSDIHIDLA